MTDHSRLELIRATGRFGFLAAAAFVVGLAFARPSMAQGDVCTPQQIGPGYCLAGGSCSEQRCFETTCDNADCPLPNWTSAPCWFCNLAQVKINPPKKPT